MSKVNILYSFRARQLFLLTLLLVGTLGVQFYLNRRVGRVLLHSR